MLLSTHSAVRTAARLKITTSIDNSAACCVVVRDPYSTGKPAYCVPLGAFQLDLSFYFKGEITKQKVWLLPCRRLFLLTEKRLFQVLA